jgi:hypothetical protein
VTDTVTITHVSEPGDIRPGDRVTILLFSDWWTRTSIVDADGFYVGCGAVEKGRACVLSVYRERTLVWARLTPSSE